MEARSFSSLRSSVPAGAVRRCAESVLRPFWEAAEAGLLESGGLGGFIAEDRGYELHRFTLRGPSDGNTEVRLGVFSTIHGDEEQGLHALAELVRQAAVSRLWLRGYVLDLYPLCNPTGYEDATRHSRRGHDLNRHFWTGSPEPEVALLERELAGRRHHGLVALHADDTSEGLYGFVRGATISRELLEPALTAAESWLPRNRAAVIDGFRAENGIIREGYEGILSAGSVFPRPFEIVFETPAGAPMDRQVAAAVAALRAIIDRYRGMLSEASDI